jgi:hypothetical protein
MLPDLAPSIRSVFVSLVLNSVDGAIHTVFMDWRHLAEMLEAGTGVFTELKNLCVWVKPIGGMGSLYRSRHELAFVWKSGRKSHINNIQLGRFGHYRTNVWEYEAFMIPSQTLIEPQFAENAAFNYGGDR